MKGYPGVTATVDAIGKLGLTGNIIPRTWSQWLTYDNGKPNPVAMLILAELCYWYRPIEEVDEATGKVIGWRKKFKVDLLQKSYQDLADCLGFTKRQVSDNVHWLQDKGILKIVSRNFSFSSNVIFIDLYADKIEQISFSLPSIKNSSSSLRENRSHVSMLDDATLERETYTEITTPEISHEIKQKYKQAEESQSSPLECEEIQFQNENLENSSSSIGIDSLSREETPEEEVRETTNEVGLITGIKTNQSRGKTKKKTKQSGGKDKQNPPSPLSRRAAQNEVIPASVRIQPKPKPETIKFRVNDIGWLQMPRSKKYTLARGIAVRRVQQRLALMFSDVDFARDDRGDVLHRENQTAMTWGDSLQLDRECFSRSGTFELTSLRDQLFAKGILKQSEFNDLLEAIFIDSVRWCESQGANAQLILKETPIALLFADNDSLMTRSLRERYEVEA